MSYIYNVYYLKKEIDDVIKVFRIIYLVTFEYHSKDFSRFMLPH